MPKKDFVIPMDGNGGYINRHIWEQKPNDSRYYDRKLDTQGTVPGISMEEAIKAFEKKYGVSLSQ